MLRLMALAAVAPASTPPATSTRAARRLMALAAVTPASTPPATSTRAARDLLTAGSGDDPPVWTMTPVDTRHPGIAGRAGDGQKGPRTYGDT